MKRLFSKILLAQGITVVLALAVVLVITRASLNLGFKDFLEQQEDTILANLAPALAELYEARGSWDFLRNRPGNWDRILRQNQPGEAVRALNAPGRQQGPGGPAQVAPWQPPVGHVLQRASVGSRLMIRQRLFLLDAEGNRVAGKATGDTDHLTLEPIVVQQETVGMIGFVPLENTLSPEAIRFLAGQLKIMAFSLLVALLLAAVAALLLARNLSRPVRKLDQTVTELSHGDFNARAAVDTADEIGRLARNVNLLAQTLERNRSAQRRWMADVAHELRTPVTVLKGEVEAVADGVVAADGSTMESIREEIDHLSTLIDDIQTLALSDAGALDIRKERVNFSEFLKQAAGVFEHRLAARDIRLEVDAGEDIELAADTRRLRQLLHNLLENGCKYIEPGGRLRLRLTRSPGKVELALDDSGPGVGESQLERLFERFYRVEESRARVTGGSGLGLSICRNIVEAHGGSIRAGHSELGGLMVHLWLPE